MGLLRQAIETLIGGISQSPPSLRDPSQVTDMVNCLPHPTYGLMKRPPLECVANLSNPVSTQSAFIHKVNRTLDDRYRVVIVDGDLRVYDDAGVAQTVQFPNGKAYLASSDPVNDFYAVTVDDTTYIVNKNVAVKAGTRKSPSRKNEALVAIRQADFSTFYQVTLDGTAVQITTTDGSTAHERADISTDRIASKLMASLTGTPAIDEAFTFTQYGSTVYIAKKDGSDFTIAVADGLADEGILAIKGTVQRFADLPARARQGFTVEIVGDPSNKFDNYFVTYDDNGAPNLAGVWKECARPGTVIDLDGTTMPFALSRRSLVLDGAEAERIPDAPSVNDDTPVVTYAGWTKGADPGYDAHSASTQVVLNEEQEAFSSILSSLNGTPATIRTTFDVDTRSMVSGSQCSVELYVSNAPGTGNIPTSAMTKVVSRQYNQGVTVYDDFFEITGSYPANTQIEIMLRYGDGVTPDNKLKRAAIRLHTLSFDDNCSIIITQSTGKRVEFEQDAIYPAGTATTVTVENSVAARVSVADETSEQLAAAIVPMLQGLGCTVTVADPQTLSVQVGGAAPSVLTVSPSFDMSTRMYSPDLGLVPGALVGKRLVNLSDGSTGTVSANTETQIAVDALTGGSANVFAVGDLCRVEQADTTFSFQPIKWTSRAAGDLTTNPDPSFVGRTISTIFFHKNRLGVTTGQGVVLSQAGDPMNFFRRTVTQVLADDMIDVQAASDTLSYFHSAVHWGSELFLWSDRGQYLLSGEPALTPQTVALTRITQFPNSANVRPVSLGRHVAFLRTKHNAVQAWEMSVVNQTGTPDARDTTQQVPGFILGKPLALAADVSAGVLAILTDYDRSSLYVQNFAFDGEDKVQEAWHRWTFEGATLLGINLDEGRLDAVLSLPSGVYLFTMDLTVGPDDALGYFMDYPGTVYADFYTSRVDLSTLYVRTPRYGQRARVETGGRLQLRHLIVKHQNSRNFDVEVTASGSSEVTSFRDTSGATDGQLRVPIMRRNTEVSLAITNHAADGFRISGLEWEGTYTVGSKAI